MTAPATLRIATRASRLARAQAQTVADSLAAALGVETDLVPITTSGDRSSAPLTEIGGQGVFVGAVRQAVVDGAAELAVHSLKDLPTGSDERVTLAAVPVRENPADCLISAGDRPLDELAAGARIGTGSLRRAAQLLARRPELAVAPIRGNVETRLAKVAAGDVDAVVLARAGLARLNLLSQVTEELTFDQMLPAPGQGALAVEIASSSTSLAADVAAVLDDPATHAAVTAERALLAGLDAGCSSPVAALAVTAPAGLDLPADSATAQLVLTGLVASPDGCRVLRLTTCGPAADACRLGDRLAQQLLADGAGELTEAVVP